MQKLVLDKNIRNWVLLPIFYIVTLIGLCRHYVMVLLKSTEDKDVKTIENENIVNRANILCENNGYISHEGVTSRLVHFKDYFLSVNDGVLTKEVETNNNPMANSSMMMDMMKSNAVMQIPNIIMMGSLTYFFSGFVLVQMPFELLDVFRGMLQKGIHLNNLDVRYVTSLSWYILVTFGLKNFYALILGEENEGDESKLMSRQMMSNTGGGKVNMSQLFQNSRDKLKELKYKNKLEDIENRFIQNN